MIYKNALDNLSDEEFISASEKFNSYDTIRAQLEFLYSLVVPSIAELMEQNCRITNGKTYTIGFKVDNMNAFR